MKLPFRRDSPATDSPWGRRIAVGVVWAAFLFMAFDYLGKRFKYRNIETWPSVEAVLLNALKSHHTVGTGPYGRFGQSSSTSVEFGSVHFQYTVNCVRYDGHHATPDGHNLPWKKTFEPWRAYYDPDSPGTAVLGPYPYHGGFLPLVLCVTGAFLVMHLYFTFFPSKTGPESPDCAATLPPPSPSPPAGAQSIRHQPLSPAPPPPQPVHTARMTPMVRPKAGRSASMRRRTGHRS